MWFSKRSRKNLALIEAVAEDDWAKADQLLQDGASPSAVDLDNVSAIVIAASAGSAHLVRLLLQYGADPDTCSEPKEDTGKPAGPACVFPAGNGSLETLTVLAEAGANLEASDKTGLTALMAAAFMGNDEIVAFLCGRGVSVDKRDQKGYTALTFAANAGQVACCERLLSAGADPNAEDNDQSTPIMFAAQHGFDGVVQLLLAHHADPRKVGSHGLSAIGLAEQNGHASTLALLQSAI